MMSRSRSGISPVVATVILVAIAIVIAIAVAFWATGLVGIFTRFEKLEIISAYQDTANTRDIIVRVRNTGSSPTAIAEVIINGVSVRQVDNPNDCKLDVGETLQVTITTTGLQGGVTYEVMLKSTGGKQYPTAILAHTGNNPGMPQIIAVQCQAPQAGGGGAGGGGTGGAGGGTGGNQTETGGNQTRT
jgi:flagellin-like protein